MMKTLGYVDGGQDVSIPAHVNFGKFIFDKIRPFGDEIALHNATTDERLSYKDLTQQAIDIFMQLKDLGVRKGDIVILGMENSINYIPRALGVILTGATLSPSPLNIGRAILKHRLYIAPPNYIVCTEAFWMTYIDVFTDFKSIKAIISLDNIFDTNFTIHVLSRINCDVDIFEPVDVLGQEDTAIIYYSSGTSGMPKGIQLTHLNCILHSLPVTFSNEDDNKSFKTGFHFGEWNSNYTDFKTFMFLASGNKIVYSELNSIEHLLNTVERYQVHVVFTIPQTIYQLIHFEAIGKYNLNSLKVIHSRSSPLDTKSILKIKEIFFPNEVQILQAYGMTECGEISSEILGPKGPKPGSVGIPSPAVILKVVDLQTSQILPPNKNGEICVKGPAVMKGYIGAERSTYIEEEGFFKTGDLGYYDDDGYFYIIDRLKDIMIVSGGYTVAPVLLEAILQLHPEVNEAGVVGKPDQIVGDLPTAFIVRKPASNVTEKELQVYVAAEVTPYMQLHGGVRFISALPRSARGKILRRRLREMLDEEARKNQSEHKN